MILLIMFLLSSGMCQTKPRDCEIVTKLKEKGLVLLSEIMPCDYVKEFLPPSEPDEPVEVEFAVYVQDITSFNAAHMEFRIDLILYMSWEDTRLILDDSAMVKDRLSIGPLPLSAYALQYLWMPDPYITNSKNAAVTSLTTIYASLNIHSNHTVRYSARVFSLISCQMAFQKYPMDVQTCQIPLQSFKYSNRLIRFKWRSDRAVTINPELKLLQFQVQLSRYFEINKTIEEFGGYGSRSMSALTFEFKFYRLIGHHLLQTYTPSFLMVALTWYSFWLGLDAVPGRVTLLTTSLLTTVTLFSGISRDLPAVAYIRAIDVWMFGCILFSFAAMSEFAICKMIKYVHEKHVFRSISDNNKPQTKSGGGGGGGGGAPNVSVVPDFFHSRNIGSLALVAQYSQMSKNMKAWAHPGDADKSADTPDAGANVNGKDINLSQKTSSVGPMPFPRKKPREQLFRPPNYPFRMASQRAKRRIWMKTIRDIEFQWDDPITGETKILWEEIDSFSRVVFPCVFFVFSAIYFTVLFLL
ncbi:glycine receptor subunit alpha-4 [Hyalella azteca]|uniref:Glycine receptor subunit alpha-4 n=1 Tax=Hyalella azteca TaxID=294128 RepID=A0A8B7PDE4_HYAAZ|nr:glycine receptor subunit alpha-4 [Hyalella azteca]